MHKFFINNTPAKRVEELKTIIEGQVGIYSCGPTVYSSPHIGNMYAYISWDILVKSLKYLGYKVNWVVNITDVGHLVADSDDGEDKMEKGSRLTGLSAWDLAKKYEAEFVENLKKLNINMPNTMCRATEHISEQIDLIKKIEANGYTYKISDGIYFDTGKFPGYGDFAHLDIEKLKEGARVESNPEKRNPTDFALWKFSPSTGSGLPRRQMEWDSPWGIGFPGWHIECTAMSTKYLGNPFDVHTGGEDHINIHHTNEVAQGYGAFGAQTANYWTHNAFITFNGEKISKSTGGLLTVMDLENMGYDPLAYRYLALTSHYRSGVSFSIEGLKLAQNSLIKLRRIVSEMPAGGKVVASYKSEFEDKISNDLAMPEVIALVWKLVKDDGVEQSNKRATLIDFDSVLQLGLDKGAEEQSIPPEIQELASKRQLAKDEKNYAEADRLRQELLNLGYVVEDSKNDCKIRKIMLS